MDPRQSVTLSDVRVEPAREVGTITGGGGICVPPGAPEWVGTMRNGVPAVAGVVPSSAAVLRLEGEYLWGGVTVAQPGNFVAEHAPRLLFSARDRPNAKVIFVLRKNAAADDLSDWFWDVLAWLGIDRDRVELVGEAPVSVERLTVFPQAEHLTGILDDLPAPRSLDPTGLPSPEYLDALAENFESKGVAPIENEVVYVSRAGTPVPLGGESYLEQLLRNRGVCVIRPEDLSVAEQMRYFAGARRLIFAEGSALHFRQLIGYRPQRITVLQRRSGRQVARGPLEPRTDSLEYVNVVNGTVLGPFDKHTGIPVGYVALPHTDPSRLMDAFRRIGIDLTADWDAEEFRTALRTDILAWARYVRTISRTSTLRYALNAVVSLTALGEGPELAQQVAHEIDPDRPLSRLQDVAPAERERDELRHERDALKRDRDALSTQVGQLHRQLDSIQTSMSLRVGHALLSPAIYVKERMPRRRS